MNPDNGLAWLRRHRLTVSLYIALAIMSLPFIFPFWWMLTSALKPPNDIFAYPPTLLPASVRLENFSDVFALQPFAQHYLNSIYIACVVTAGTLLCASLAGYGFARIRFWGSGALFLLLLSALMMPAEVTIIPNFTLMQALGLTDSHVPLIVLPIVGGNGVIATFIMRQYMLGLPKELEEAAALDGLTRWGMYWRIALPLARPALISVGILSFLHSWNLFLEPLVFITDQQLFTLPLSLRSMTDEYGQSLWHVQLAATSLSVIPVLIVYIFAQRHVVESFAMSGTKG
jgi:multiple sugar transport system permease protein